MATQTGTLKAGYKLVIEGFGAEGVDYDVSLQGADVSISKKQIANSQAYGPYEYDATYTVTVISGSPSIYKVQPNGMREYDSANFPEMLPGQSVVVGKNTVTQMAAGISDAQTPDGNYIACIIGKQVAGSGRAKDISKAGNDLFITTTYSDAAMWANAGYITVGTGTGLAPSLFDKNATNMDLFSESFALSFTVNAAAPGASQVFIGNTNQASTSFPGIYISLRTSGAIRPIINSSAESLGAALLDSTGLVATGADVDMALTWDHISQRMTLFIAGSMTDQWHIPITASTKAASPFHWGFGHGGDTGLGVRATYASKWKNIHFLKFDMLPINVCNLIKNLLSDPTRPVSVDEILYPAKYINVLVGPAQSNELGTGETADRVSALGIPQRDPLGPNLGVSSMWPRLSAKAAERYTALNVFNGAVGSTSIVQQWCGKLRAWATGMLVGNGDYTLNAGRVYKCTLGSGTTVAFSTSTVAPTHTSGSVTGGDSVPWLFVRNATAEDTDGKVYDKASSLFDPNGFFAAIVSYKKPKADDNYALISIGQGDKTYGTSRASYAQGLINSIEYWKSAGVKALLGFTCYSDLTEAWFQSDLIPAYNDVLAIYANDPMVLQGANLREDLGVLPQATVARSPVPSIMNYAGSSATSTNLHMNDAALRLAADAWHDAMLSAGIL